jgi:hypothetical protein
MSTILGEFGEAYISLMRQGEEVRKYIRHSGGNAFEWKSSQTSRVSAQSGWWIECMASCLRFDVCCVSPGFYNGTSKAACVAMGSSGSHGILQKCLSKSGIDEVTFLRFDGQFKMVTP